MHGLPLTQPARVAVLSLLRRVYQHGKPRDFIVGYTLDNSQTNALFSETRYVDEGSTPPAPEA